jgi:hypothetical protein
MKDREQDRAYGTVMYRSLTGYIPVLSSVCLNAKKIGL